MAMVGIFPKDLVGARFEETSTTALFQPGTIARDNMGGLWVYVKAASAVTIYDFCTISDALIPLIASATTTTFGTPVAPANVGIAQVAFASADYGWIWRGPGGGVGRGIKVNAAASCVLDVVLYTTAVAGVVDDANVDECAIAGLKLTATITGAAATECIATTYLSGNLGEPD